MVPVPSHGRVFERHRPVRLGDASPGGRLRLDALARYLQDVSNDDTRDVGMAEDVTWVVRRIVLVVARFPVLGENLRLRTFCSGIASHWAERRVRVDGDRGGRADAATLWVHVDPTSGRPAPLPEGFVGHFGASAAGRTVRARLRHGAPPDAASAAAWPLRFTDFDVLGHVNNAAAWSAVEEVLSTRRNLRAPLRAELEFRNAITERAAVDLRVLDGTAAQSPEETPAGAGSSPATSVWLTGGATVFVSAELRGMAP